MNTTDVLAILRPIWETKTETATRVRQRIEAVLDAEYAARHWERMNPARWRNHLDKLLPKPSKVRAVRHFPALPYAELPAFMVRLRAEVVIAARALEFLILTAARTNMVTGAKLSEIVDDEWRVSALVHVVPPVSVMVANLQEKDRNTARIAGTGERIPGVQNMDAWRAAEQAGMLGDSVGFVDADNFKQVNDQFGHPAGDAAIKAIGQALADDADPGTVYHRGGDEFQLSGNPEAIHRTMARVNARLAQSLMRFTDADGRTLQRSIFLSHGVGNGIEEAENALHETKRARLESGLRTERTGAGRRADDARGSLPLGSDAGVEAADQGGIATRAEATEPLNPAAGGVSASGDSTRSSDAVYGTPARHPWVELDDSRNIPYAGGVSADGRTVYISRYMPDTVEAGGKTIDAKEGVFVHEVEEQKVMLPDGPKSPEYMKALRHRCSGQHHRLHHP